VIPIAERNETVRLLANVTNYVAGMEQARAYATYVGTAAEQAERKLRAQGEAFETIGKVALGFGAAVAVGIGAAVLKFAEFDQAMSQVQASTQESSENMDLLREAALRAGADSVFTATEAANAIEELGKAGLTTANILGGALDGALTLAASSGLGIARAAEISAVSLSQFGLEGDRAAHVADVLSAGAGKALGSVDDLANGLKFVGPVAASMNVSLEETTGVLALFAQQGIIGEQAGTSLRGVIASLTSPSAAARTEIERLGLSLYDANGDFLGLQNAAGELSREYTTMNGAARDASLGVIFGRETVTAATALYQAGAKGVGEWTTAVDDSGYAARVAADRLDNLRGDMEKLGGAFDTALIQGGTGANDTLRALTQGVTLLVDGLGSLDEGTTAVALGLGVVTAATALSGGAALIAIPKYVAAKAALDDLNISGRRAAVGIGLVGAGIGGAVLLGSVIVGHFAAIKANADELRDSLDQTTGALTDYSRELVAKKLAEGGAFEAAKAAGVSQKELTDAVLAGGDALDEVQDKMRKNNDGITDLFTGRAWNASQGSKTIRDLRTSLDDSEESFKNLKAAEDDTADSSEEVTSKLGDVGFAASDATGEIEALVDAIRNFGADQFDVEQTTSSFYAAKDALAEAAAAVDDLDTAANEGASLDVLTEGGRNTLNAMLELAKNTNDAAAAMYANGDSAENVAARLDEGRQSIIDTRMALGDSADEAQRYADNLIATPADVITNVQLTGVAVAEAALAELTRYRTTFVDVKPGNGSSLFLPQPDVNRAGGGIIPGAPSDVDNVILGAATGEFVTRASVAADPNNRSALEYMNRGGDIRDYGQAPTYVPAPSRDYATAPGSGGNTVHMSVVAGAEGPNATASKVEQRLNKKKWGER
jgi:TP901 family phage tail tape measure protein